MSCSMGANHASAPRNGELAQAALPSSRSAKNLSRDGLEARYASARRSCPELRRVTIRAVPSTSPLRKRLQNT